MLAISAFVASQVVGIVLVLLLNISGDNVFVAGLFSFCFGLVTYAAFLAVLVLASRRKGLGTLAADFGLRFQPIDIPIGIGAAITAKVAAIVIGALAITITGQSPNTSNLQLSSDPLWIVLNGVVIATLVAPFVEELVFRGLVLRSVRNVMLRTRAGHPAPTEQRRRAAVALAILLSAGAFAALHLVQATSLTMLLVLGGATFAVGIINATLAIVTGRLGAAIITHVLYNGSSVVLALLLSASGTAQ
jgi:uncharacterized protein